VLGSSSITAQRGHVGLPIKCLERVYNEHLSSGKATTQVLVMLGRKLARIAFSLMKNQSEYQPKGGILA
jgi:hypothetical protein